MSGRLRFLFLAALLLPATAGAQATLNKCIDAHGGVTYSNLPCKNAREVQRIEVDPAAPTPPAASPAPPNPQPPTAAPATRSAPPPPVSPPASKAPKAASPAPATPSTPPAARAPRAPAPAAAPALGTRPQCERISAQLGEVLDKMDQARRQGASASQMDAWNDQIRELERKKQQTGCF